MVCLGEKLIQKLRKSFHSVNQLTAIVVTEWNKILQFLLNFAIFRQNY